jgi:hypothetical protein
MFSTPIRATPTCCDEWACHSSACPLVISSGRKLNNVLRETGLPEPNSSRVVGYPEVIHFVVPRAVRNKLEVAAGLEPAKIGFADRRLDHFGIATLYTNPLRKLYLNRLVIAYLSSRRICALPKWGAASRQDRDRCCAPTNPCALPPFTGLKTRHYKATG